MTQYSTILLDACAHGDDVKKAIVKYIRKLLEEEDEKATYQELKKVLNLAQYANPDRVRKAANSGLKDYLYIRPALDPLDKVDPQHSLSRARLAVLQEERATLLAEYERLQAELAQCGTELKESMERLVFLEKVAEQLNSIMK